MAFLTSASSSSSSTLFPCSIRRRTCQNVPNLIHPNLSNPRRRPQSIFTHFSNRNRTPFRFRSATITCQLCTHETLNLNSGLDISVAVSEDEFWAAACLRVRSFNDFQDSSFGVEDHKKYLTELEFDALKERIAGTRVGFKRVTCINATLPLSQIPPGSDELSSACKFSENGEDRVVVGTLDLNQCLRLPDEITGKRPEGDGADFSRAYLSNVCVAKELQRNGLGYLLIAKSKKVALEWGMTDLYVHVAFDNEAARKLYTKSGFVYENDEPAWQARFLDRPRRLLLWGDLSLTQNL